MRKIRLISSVSQVFRVQSLVPKARPRSSFPPRSPFQGRRSRWIVWVWLEVAYVFAPFWMHVRSLPHRSLKQFRSWGKCSEIRKKVRYGASRSIFLDSVMYADWKHLKFRQNLIPQFWLSFLKISVHEIPTEAQEYLDRKVVIWIEIRNSCSSYSRF